MLLHTFYNKGWYTLDMDIVLLFQSIEDAYLHIIYAEQHSLFDIAQHPYYDKAYKLLAT